MNRVLPDDKKLNQSMTSIKVGENPKTNKGVIAEGFNLFFTSIVKAIGEKLSQISDPSCQRQWSPSQNAEAVLTNVTFELSPVKIWRGSHAVEKTKTDNIPARLLKDGDPVISECLTHIINLSFASGVMPNDWKIARVVPLFKSGNRQEMNNYRSVSILPVISKIAEKVVYHQLSSYLDANNLLSPCHNLVPRTFSLAWEKVLGTRLALSIWSVSGRISPLKQLSPFLWMKSVEIWTTVFSQGRFLLT